MDNLRIVLLPIDETTVEHDRIRARGSTADAAKPEEEQDNDKEEKPAAKARS